MNEPEQKSSYCTGERKPFTDIFHRVFAHDESIEIVVHIELFCQAKEKHLSEYQYLQTLGQKLF